MALTLPIQCCLAGVMLWDRTNDICQRNTGGRAMISEAVLKLADVMLSRASYAASYAGCRRKAICEEER